MPATVRIMEEMEKRGEELVGIYHSHTGAPPIRAADVNLPPTQTPVYVIVSLEVPRTPDVRGFWIRDGADRRAELDVI